MKTFALAALAATAMAADTLSYNYKFFKWAAEHNKVYETVEEFETRLAHFIKTDLKIEELNARGTMMVSGHNHMSDWSQQEYIKLLGLREIEHQQREAIWPFKGTPSNADSLDWRDVAGAVTPVKDQGACGSCWAFSATEAVESAYAIAGNDQVIMAPQELVDCTRSLFGNHGCNGGWYYYAYDWLKNNMTMREADYPYTSGTTGDETDCAYDSSKGVTTVSGYKQVSRDTDSIKAAIEIGPVNVAVAAGNDVFRNYSSGVVTEADGCPTRVDHAIVAVGYGTEDGVGYYIVRNSWNTTWGDQGYIKIAQSTGKGVCGINQDVYYPII